MIHKAKTSFRLMPLVLLLLAAAMQGCKDDEIDDTLPFTRFPMEVGKKWSYRTVFNFVQLSQQPVESMWEVVRTEMLNGKLTYVIRKYKTTNNGKTYMGESYYTENSYGLWHYAENGSAGSLINFKKEDCINFNSFYSSFTGPENDTLFEDSLIIFNEPPWNLKYPVALGEEWVYYHIQNTIITYLHKYEGMTQVTTPAGIFETTLVSNRLESSSTSNTTQFFSNEGLIKEVLTGTETDTNGVELGTFTIVTELISLN